MRLVTILAMSMMLIGMGCDRGGQEEGEAQPPKESSTSGSEGAAAQEGEESGDEHPGDEHAGEEHPGDEHAGDEHPGDDHAGEEHPGDEAESDSESYSASDVKKAMKSHIESETDDSGVFQIQDSKEEKKLNLKFVKIHDPVRRVDGKGHFACTDFHVEGNEDKLYDLDFWLNPEDGELKVTETKIHKHPVKKDGTWKKKARFTYKDDEPVKVE